MTHRIVNEVVNLIVREVPSLLTNGIQRLCEAIPCDRTHFALGCLVGMDHQQHDILSGFNLATEEPTYGGTPLVIECRFEKFDVVHVPLMLRGLVHNGIVHQGRVLTKWHLRMPPRCPVASGRVVVALAKQPIAAQRWWRQDGPPLFESPRPVVAAATHTPGRVVSGNLESNARALVIADRLVGES